MGRAHGNVTIYFKGAMKQKSITALKNKLWKLCREITDKRYPSYCYTCNRPIEGSGKQLGHFIPSSVGGASLRYNLDQLRWQCYNCNINKSGNWPVFFENLTNELGKAKITELMNLKNQIIQADRYWYESKIAEYQGLL